MEIALRVVQFWCEIKLVLTNCTPASRSCNFVITRLISHQIALHSVQLPLLITCQHHWLEWLDEDVDFVRIISFDLSKAFDSVPHDIICEKLKATNLNPYVINWIIDFPIDRKQRVVVDRLQTEYVDITRGVPQGTVLGPFLFSLMVNDSKSVDDDNNLLLKFADDITVHQ